MTCTADRIKGERRKKTQFAFRPIFPVALFLAGATGLSRAQAPVAPADPWPHQTQLTGAAVTVYQPQVDAWDGNQIQVRAAVAIKPTGAHGGLQRRNHPEAAGVKSPTFPVRNDPPCIIVSNTPSILIPIDGAPIVKPLPDESRFKRVINTRALILRGGTGDSYYLHVYDGWLSSSSLDGPWTQASRTPFGMSDAAKGLAASGSVDMLTGSGAPKPALANGVPTIYVSQVPTELIVFKGNPAFVPSNALPADFARIPLNSPAAVVLASVAGTPQAQEAVIANAIPQTATVPLTNGPSFVPVFDGAPQFQPIAGTPLSNTTNASVPIRVISAVRRRRPPCRRPAPPRCRPRPRLRS